MERWFIGVQAVTENYLTWRQKRKFRKKEKQKKRNVVIEWLDAFLWAAVVVLLINQYLFQAYQIPTGSMENTLKIQDRIFVNKLIFGPELLPGLVKLPGFTEPTRAKIIIFESPTYLSKGTLFDIIQRVLYMLTLSIVDIDRDEEGKPRAHFLIKRAVATERDRIRIRQGEVDLRLPGTAEWVPERELQIKDAVEYTIRRNFNPAEYDIIRAAVRVSEWKERGLEPEKAQNDILRASRTTPKYDAFERYGISKQTLHEIVPHHTRYRSEYWRYELGWYIPDGWIFPMGDNRDNSNDARYFGPVRLKKVLGKAMFIYWPLSRIGAPK